MDGGAIDARNADYVTLSLSSFVHCVSHTTSSTSGGGGINCNNIQQQPFIHCCLFLLCESDDDGAGVSIWNAHGNPDIYLCNECIFLEDTARNGGGGLIVDTTDSRACSNCLLSHSLSGCGGALYLHYSFYSSEHFLTQFCFFHANSLYSSGVAKDAAIESYFKLTDSIVLFQQCFSTSGSNRLGDYYNERWHNTDLDWLSFLYGYIQSEKYLEHKRHFSTVPFTFL